MFRKGDGVPKDQKRAIDLLTKAANKGGEAAAASLGSMHIKGQGTNKNIQLGLKILERAARAGNEPAERALGTELIALGQKERGFKWLKKGSDRSDPYSMVLYATNLLKSNPTPAQSQEAIELMKLAASKGYQYAIYSLGYHYETGVGVKKSSEDAFVWYYKGANLNNKNSIKRIGYLYYNGTGVSQDYKKAIKWFQRAADLGDISSFSMLGYIFQSGQGTEINLEKSRYFYKKGVESNDPLAMVSYAYLQASEDNENIDFRNSIDLVEKAVKIIDDTGTKIDTQKAQVYEKIGRFYTNRGSFSKATTFFQKAIRFHESKSEKNSREYIWALEGYGTALQQSGRYIESEKIFKMALLLANNVEQEKNNILYSLNYSLALLRESEGNFEEAKRLYSELRGNLRFAFGVDTRLREGLIAATLGRINMELDELTSADNHFKDAFKFLQSFKLRNEPEYLRLIGDYARLKSRQEKHEEAISLFERIFKKVRQIGLLDHPLVTLAGGDYAKSLFKVGRDTEAIRLLNGLSKVYASRLTRQSRESLTDSISERQVIKASLVEQTSLLISNYSDRSSLEDRESADLSFRSMQLIQRASAGDSVSQMAARVGSVDDSLASIIRLRQDLLSEWRELNRASIASLGKNSASQIKINPNIISKELQSIGAKIEKLDHRIITDFPGYFELTSSRALSISVVQELLAADEALLLYAVGAHTSFVFVVRRDRVLAREIKIGAKEITDAVTALRKGLDGQNVVSRADVPDFDTARAFQLYQKLFEPVAPLLDGVRHVLVVPDGALQSLPFGVLVTEKPKGESTDFSGYRQTAWLARKYAMSILPSVSSLRALRTFAKPSKASRPFLGVGDPQLTGETGSGPKVKLASLFLLRGVADVDQVRQLASLPESAGELRSLGRTLGASNDDLILGDDATETRIKQTALQDYKVLAFATHGLVAGELKGLSEPALVLTPPATATEQDDGLLTASEIATLNLDADWVILSACNTAAPDGTPGAEGLSGLAKAFFYAGSRALLVSHWPVVSDAAVRITTRMLTEAQKPGIGRAEAHRRAMLALIDDKDRPHYAHPMFWAPFVVVGEGGAARQ